ncbi:MAG: hypothetical protein H7Z73_01260 [Candidatus Saccharibacteria bacterium]|nr:hypothetical protein [Moraxellaceae bacterium]
MDNFDFTDMHMMFTLKRIVFVNSANHAYSEIMLDHHMAMFGRNNAGKTASLAATKLLLFPEVDFRQCEKKFRFEGKGGMYNCEDSYQFYFPSPSSFLAMEVENPSGTFCMVLYRSNAINSFGYHRFFIPVDYETLRHQFWDCEREAFAENMCVESLHAFMKQHKGIGVTEQKRLIEIMFGSLGRADALFCVVPLKDSGADSIKAFKNIYNLAFASGGSESSILPSAIAALIEMKRGREAEKVSTNLTRVYEEYQALFKQGKQLELYANHLESFEKLEQMFEMLFSKVKRYSATYHHLKVWRAKSLETYAPKCKEVDRLFDDAVRDQMLVKNEIKRVEQEFYTLDGTLKSHEKELNNTNDLINKCQSIIVQYHGNHSIAEIIEILKEDIEEQKESLASYQSEEETGKRLERKTQLLKQKTSELGALKSVLQNQSDLLLNQIDSHSVQIFNALNPHLNRINLKIDHHAIDTIQSFTQLFTTDVDRQTLYFQESPITGIRVTPFNASQPLESIQQEYDQVSEEIFNLTDEVDVLKARVINFKNKELTALEINKLKKNLSDSENDVNLLSGFDYLTRQIPIKQQTLLELMEQKKQLSDHLALKKATYTAAQQNVEVLQASKDHLSESKDFFEMVKKSLERAEDVYDPMAFQLLGGAIVLDLDDVSIKQQADALIKTATQCQSEKSKFEATMEGFMAKVADEKVDPSKIRSSLIEWIADIETYKTSFGNLEYKRIDFSERVRGHNEDIRLQIDEIHEASAQINRTVSDINQKLNGQRISNLSEIKLHLETTSDFNAINNTLSKHNISGETLAEEGFYTSLLKFFEAHQNTNTGLIKMADLIKSITYHYTVNGTQVMTKSQSGGTTSTVTAFVLSVLLNEIKMTDTIVRMPIIVDEISTLDPANSQATINQISAQGFSIFCATPAFNAHIVSEVGRFIFIDQFKPASIMVEGCDIHIMPHHIAVFGASVGANA